ncbi:GvpL/GvpF family gas vesicle protein [Streptomyces sp. NPDC127068]|uniref:GvpL/GvpF family gas vesicle protein n=1 Tax=Streptomyces sp. NPDC127068 TaxID=3347127 RepID=UPI00364E8C69
MTDPRYLYAVCRPWNAPIQVDLRGVAGAPPKELRHGSLVAVVSTVPARDFEGEALRAHLADPRWRADLIRSHEAVVAALTTVTTPLPVRPGAVFPDDSAVRVLLAAEGDRLDRVLDRLADRVEWEVTVTVAAADAARVDGADPVRELHDRLSTLADAARFDPPGRFGAPVGPAEPVLLRAAYLVPRGACEEFVEAVEHHRGDPRARPGPQVSLSGPWAPYSFTPAPYGDG